MPSLDRARRLGVQRLAKEGREQMTEIRRQKTEKNGKTKYRIQETKSKGGKNGIMEYWSDGVMEYWLRIVEPKTEPRVNFWRTAAFV